MKTEWGELPSLPDPDNAPAAADAPPVVETVSIQATATPDWRNAAAADTEPDTEMHFPNLDAFVRTFVVTTFRRRVGPQAKYRWAADWFRNSEAIVRLDAMWRAWEQARRETTGMARWLRDTADPQMQILLDPDGPFRSSQDTNGPDEPLPYNPPPGYLFTDERSRPRYTDDPGSADE